MQFARVLNSAVDVNKLNGLGKRNVLSGFTAWFRRW